MKHHVVHVKMGIIYLQIFAINVTISAVLALIILFVLIVRTNIFCIQVVVLIVTLIVKQPVMVVNVQVVTMDIIFLDINAFHVIQNAKHVLAQLIIVIVVEVDII